MVPFLKSRRVHDQKHHENNDPDTKEWASLTLWRKSLVFNCKGFTVFDRNGNLVYRVDNYLGRRPNEIVLMDGSGVPILTLCRSKKLRPIDSWFVYEGEIDRSLQKEPICCMRKPINVLQRPSINMLAHVYLGQSDKKHAYKIEGSYAKRSCRLLDESMRVVAEIKRKVETKGGVSFGLDVFVLLVSPGFNHNIAMAIVLLLDQMFS